MTRLTHSIGDIDSVVKGGAETTEVGCGAVPRHGGPSACRCWCGVRDRDQLNR
jgi:hypothetical protein